ncbi:MAG: polyprenyl synthetase family protein [Candidatus Dormibacteraeota bacterium]|nr:polyprenyl synthetase family protein [Candidatus Dormibacteraeota bacterium]
MHKPAAVRPLDTPAPRVEELADAVRGQRPLPPADSAVLQGYAAVADEASGNGDWAGVAEIVVAAELVDRGFRFHRLTEDAICRRDELLLGDYCLVCAAELATRLGRADVEIEFSRAAMTAAIGEPYEDSLRSAVATAASGPGSVAEVIRPVPAGADAAEDEGREVDVVEAQIHQLLAEDPDAVGRPMADLLDAGGKRIRPQLAYLASRLGDAHDPARAATLASVVEFIHNATLVHDDVVDESPMRRGRPAVHVAYGPGVAVRVGDFYFGRAAALLAELDNTRTTRLIVEAVSRVCEAQIEEFSYRGMDNLDESGYLRIVEGKTAALFSGACAAGAALGCATDEVVEAMAAYGHNLGVAFQMVDDVLDFSPDSGKALVQDLRQSVGLPLVYAAQDRNVRALLTALLDSEDGFDAEAAIAIVRDAGALDRSLARASAYRDKAVAALDVVPASDVRKRLGAIADFAIERRN